MAEELQAVGDPKAHNDDKAMRLEYEFTCVGCGENVYAAIHFGPAATCFMCQELGPEMTKLIRARIEGLPS